MPNYEFSRIHLFGGTPLIRRLADELSKTYPVQVWTAPRQFNDAFPDYTDRGYPVAVVDDIDKAFDLERAVGALGIGMGQAWRFGKPMVQAFGGRLLDFMSIPYPYYLGAAHLTHAMLRGEDEWGCCMQVVTENTEQGVVHDGDVIHKGDMPLSFQETLTNERFHQVVEDRSLAYVLAFIREAAAGRHFTCAGNGFVRSPFASEMMFPRLNTREQAWLDWSWTMNEVTRFIRAFDAPYPGARTHLLTDDGPKVVTLHNLVRQYPNGSHPFQAGLILGRCDGAWLVALRDGLMVVDLRIDGAPFTGPPGQRLFTRRETLDDALLYQPNYTPLGDANARTV